eukprot:SAG31_NODE_11586_length_1015_cov_2.784934_1_plen_37_part_10
MRPEQLGWYAPYRWLVRHCAEGEVAEVVLAFDPLGRP